MRACSADMAMGVIPELRVFFLCATAGVACGILFDFVRIIRRSTEGGPVLTFFMDILFWLLAAFLTFGMLLFANFGRLRLFEFVSLLLGAVLYFLSASSLVVSGGMFVLNTVAKTVEMLLKILFLPLKWILNPVFLFFSKIYGKIFKKIRKIGLTTSSFWFKIKKRLSFYRQFMRK